MTAPTPIRAAVVDDEPPARDRIQTTTLQRANMELWRTIALVGLGVLMVEWWFYHKRTA